jgi:prophage antirepressor-like protein
MSKENSIVPFQFQEKEIRTATKDDGSVWFAAKDVADALSIAWSGKTLAAIPDEWKWMMSFITHEGKRELTVISEPAVYKLAFRSNKPGAENFTNWVASEVLPTLRRTGQYSLNENLLAKSQGELKEFVASAFVEIQKTLQRGQQDFEQRLSALENQEQKSPNQENLSENLAESFFIKHLNQVVKIRPDVRKFLIEKTIIHPDAGTLLSWMYLMYEQWCYANCHVPIGRVLFYNECRMALAGYGEVKAARGNRLYVTGIRLRDDKDM